MTRKATTEYCVEIEEALDYGMSTKYIAKKLNIPHDILLQVLAERRQQRDEWQQIVNDKYKNKNILER